MVCVYLYIVRLCLRSDSSMKALEMTMLLEVQYKFKIQEFSRWTWIAIRKDDITEKKNNVVWQI